MSSGPGWDLFTYFRTCVPGSAASIASGVTWLGSVEPKDGHGMLFIPTLETLRQPTHFREMLGESVVQRLLEDGEAEFQGRPLSVVTARDLSQRRVDLFGGGPVLAMWPTLGDLRLLAAKRGGSPVGVVVWSYDKDVAPLLESSDEASWPRDASRL